MKILILTNFNNYENRLIKKKSNWNDYKDLASSYLEVEKVNFTYNDQMNAELVINYTSLLNQPDYLVIGTDDANPVITSRWYIINTYYLNSAQVKAILRRDVVADNYDATLSAPCFVEKGFVPDSNPLIYNSERTQYNQIKKKEYFLKDKTKMAWLVGYVARGYSVSPNVIESQLEILADYDQNSFEWDFDQDYLIYDNVKLNVEIRSTAHFPVDYGSAVIVYEPMHGTFSYLSNVQNYVKENAGWPRLQTQYKSSEIYSKLNVYIKNRLEANSNYFQNIIYNNSITNDELNKIRNLNNKIYYDSDTGKYYKIGIYEEATFDNSFADLSFKTVEQNIANSNNYLTYEDSFVSKNSITLSFKKTKIKIIKTLISDGTVKIPISNTRRELNDAPYDMFCIPFPTEDNNPIISYSGNDIEIESSLALFAAQAIGAEGGTGGSAWVYDIQLLPYCPLNLITNESDGVVTITVDDLTANIDYDFIKVVENGVDVNKQIIFWCRNSSGTLDILAPEDMTFESIENLKVSNECDNYRLCSPNYQGIFDFSIAKNGGVTSFNVDYTYKPYNPYIHVNPNFGGLYGQDFNDVRGLICNGDFSIAIVSDQFKSYEISNKNYENIFNRQIQNLDVNRKYQRIEEIAGVATGVLGGAAQGAIAGSTTGTGAGAIAGGIIGGIGAGVTGLTDLYLSQQRFKENRQYQIDQFNMNIQNIQALPNCLTKVSAFTSNYKFFPYIEYYSCSEEEREAFKEKLKYNGMTVGVIGTLGKYMGNQYEYNFVQGEIIRLNIGMPANIALAIYTEIKRGIYLWSQNE